MRTSRVVLIILGIGLAVVGLAHLWDRLTVASLLELIAWLIGALVVHDGIIAPLAIATGTALWWLTKRTRPGVQQCIVSGVFVAGVVALFAIPLVAREGKAHNPTALMQPYTTNLLWLLAIIAATTISCAVLASRTRDNTKLEHRPPQR